MEALNFLVRMLAQVGFMYLVAVCITILVHYGARKPMGGIRTFILRSGRVFLFLNLFMVLLSFLILVYLIIETTLYDGKWLF